MVVEIPFPFSLCLPNSKKNEEKQWPQIVAIIISTFAGITNGLLYSWVSPFFIKITEDKVNYDITEEQASHLNTIHPLAMLLVAPLFSKLPDTFGRKRTLLLISVPQIAAWLCLGFGKSVYVFYTAKVLAGFCDAVFFAAMPIYVGEIAIPAVRGSWGNLLAISYYIGEFLINVIGSYCEIRATSFICIPLPMMFLVLFSMMPESPYFYLMRGEEDKARESLIFLRRTTDIEDTFTKLKADVARQMSESGTWKDLFKIKSNRKALIAGLFLRFSQQMSGMIVFITYTQFIFQKSGGNISNEVGSMIYTGLQVGLNLVVLLFIVSKLSRRTSYIVSHLCTAAILYVMATFYYIDSYTVIDLSAYKWVPISTMVIYQIFASVGITIIPTLMLSELFSASIKAKAMVIMVLTFGLGSFLTNYIFYYVNILLGFYAPFYVFAICNTLSGVLSFFVIPETKGKTLEEIQQLLKRSKVDVPKEETHL